MTAPVTPERTYLGTRGDSGWTRCSRSDCQREHAEHHAGELAMLCPAVVSKPVTPETLTDEMIRELRATLLRESGNQFTCDTDATGMALYDLDKFPPHLRDSAQAIKNIACARCAEIINARRAKEQP